MEIEESEHRSVTRRVDEYEDDCAELVLCDVFIPTLRGRGEGRGTTRTRTPHISCRQLPRRVTGTMYSNAMKVIPIPSGLY